MPDLKNIFVVGGASGIGRKIALDFAMEGHQVAVADINKNAMESMIKDYDLSSNVFSFQVDVSSWESVQAMTEQVVQKLGKVDTFIFSAGITQLANLDEVDWNLWKKTIAINLHGLFFGIKAIYPHMIEQGKGSMIIIGSGSAITGSGGGIQYYTSKGGAIGLMRSLCTELGQHGININVIAPRVIESQMLDILYPTEELKLELAEKIPMRRFGTPSDISELVKFLSGDKAKYMHGQVLLLDGGRTYKSKLS